MRAKISDAFEFSAGELWAKMCNFVISGDRHWHVWKLIAPSVSMGNTSIGIYFVGRDECFKTTQSSLCLVEAIMSYCLWHDNQGVIFRGTTNIKAGNWGLRPGILAYMCSRMLIIAYKQEKCVVDSEFRSQVSWSAFNWDIQSLSWFPTQFGGDLQGLSEISKFSKSKQGNNDCDPGTYPNHLQIC